MKIWGCKHSSHWVPSHWVPVFSCLFPYAELQLSHSPPEVVTSIVTPGPSPAGLYGFTVKEYEVLDSNE